MTDSVTVETRFPAPSTRGARAAGVWPIFEDLKKVT
jgi:hypothetical protein